MSRSHVSFSSLFADPLPPHSNADAKLSNPLRGIPRDRLLSEVEIFARERGLTHILPDLRKGALVAQDPEGAFHESALLAH